MIRFLLVSIAFAFGCVQAGVDFHETGARVSLAASLGFPECTQYDYDNDGVISISDFGQFKAEFLGGARSPEEFEDFKRCFGGTSR